MKQDFSRENIKKYQTSLCKINAEKIDRDPDGDRLSIKREDKYEIKDLNNNIFTLRLFSKVYAEPEALFCIYLEYEINYEFTHEVDKKFIKKNIDELLHPLGSDVSYLTSTLSKMLTNSYFIMPPSITIEKEKAKK